MRTFWFSILLSSSTIACGGLAFSQPLGPEDADCPTPEIQDSKMAASSPDEYAWRLFVALNQPGDPASKCPVTDPAKGRHFGDAGPALWETWRNARVNAPDGVFFSGAKDPGTWRSRVAPGSVRRPNDFTPNFKLNKNVEESVRRLLSGQKADSDVGENDEVRMNRDAYLLIKADKLYDRTVLASKAATGTLNLSLPAASKEIKAQWRRIRDEDKPRYHWVTFQRDSGPETWGLTALHITTKDLPEWFWATFEHIDNKLPGNRPGGPEFGQNEGWQLKSVDSFSCPKSPSECDLVPAGLGLENTPWANYRLRGTQIAFVTRSGEPTRLASSQMEVTHQEQSSCMTCHAIASTDRRGRFKPFEFVVGKPDPARLEDPETHERAMQTDFMWSLAIMSQRPNP